MGRSVNKENEASRGNTFCPSDIKSQESAVKPRRSTRKRKETEGYFPTGRESPKQKKKKRRVAKSKKPNVKAQKKPKKSPPKKSPPRDSESVWSKIYRSLELSETPREITGRQKEFDFISDFIDSRLKSKSSGSLFICGPPGTGKSASISRLITALKSRKSRPKPVVVMINCMRCQPANTVYTKIYEALEKPKDRIKKISAAKAADEIESCLLKISKKGSNVVVFLDEIDGLLGQQQQKVLYKLFEWAKRDWGRKKRNIILIGIANTLDLTDRFLPRLAARQCAPDRMTFEAYSLPQLVDIVNARINSSLGESEEVSKYFDPKGIEFLCRKVAAVAGDVRKCLEICRHCVREITQSSPKKDAVVDFSLMHQTLNSFFASPLIETIENLPSFQQTVLCVAFRLFRCSESGKRSVDDILEFYSFLVQRCGLPRSASDRLIEIINGLVTETVLSVTSAKGSRDRHAKHDKVNVKRSDIISLNLQEEDLEIALENHNYFTVLLKKNINVPERFFIRK